MQGYRPRFTRVEENYGVLIAGCSDNAAAVALLKKLRTLPFPDVRLPNGKPCYAFEWVDADTPDGRQVADKRPSNPFHMAIVCRNPVAPAQPRQKIDPAWAKLNSEEEYSVFKCPKPWTMVVKQYAGMGVTQEITASSGGGIMDKLWPTKHQGESLNAAGYNAHELAKTLRKLGFEAYVLHTRTHSIVTVGAFNTSDPYDPEKLRLKQRLDGLRPAQPGQPDPLGLFAYQLPVPMEVPR
jgi:hypothetical protein